MSHPTTRPRTTGVLDVPGARLHYEVRGSGPLVVLVGNPMDADSFTALADHLAGDHTVLTTDPRGIHRSPVSDPDADVAADLRADDLSRLITHLAPSPRERVAVVGSSGGAVSALALAQTHPGQVHIVIAHEPPLQELLDDRNQLRAAVEEIVATHHSGHTARAWLEFLAHVGTAPPAGGHARGAGAADEAPSVAPFTGAGDMAFFFEHLIRPTTGFTPDLSALREGGPQVAVGIGEESSGQLCDRTSSALAESLGTRPVAFPGGHVGFVTHPAGFADRVRAVLRSS